MLVRSYNLIIYFSECRDKTEGNKVKLQAEAMCCIHFGVFPINVNIHFSTVILIQN